MPLLPKNLAAKHLRISVSKLRRVTAGGFGRVGGAAGRGNAALFDVDAIRARLEGRCSKAEAISRGARATTAADAIDAELEWVKRLPADLLHYGVRADQVDDLVDYFGARMRKALDLHFARKSAQN